MSSNMSRYIQVLLGRSGASLALEPCNPLLSAKLTWFSPLGAAHSARTLNPVHSHQSSRPDQLGSTNSPRPPPFGARPFMRSDARSSRFVSGTAAPLGPPRLGLLGSASSDRSPGLGSLGSVPPGIVILSSASVAWAASAQTSWPPLLRQLIHPRTGTFRLGPLAQTPRIGPPRIGSRQIGPPQIGPPPRAASADPLCSAPSARAPRMEPSDRNPPPKPSGSDPSDRLPPDRPTRIGPLSARPPCVGLLGVLRPSAA